MLNYSTFVSTLSTVGVIIVLDERKYFHLHLPENGLNLFLNLLYFFHQSQRPSQCRGRLRRAVGRYESGKEREKREEVGSRTGSFPLC